MEAHCREHAAGAPSAGAPLGDDDIELAGRLVAEADALEKAMAV